MRASSYLRQLHFAVVLEVRFLKGQIAKSHICLALRGCTSGFTSGQLNSSTAHTYELRQRHADRAGNSARDAGQQHLQRPRVGHAHWHA